MHGAAFPRRRVLTILHVFPTFRIGGSQARFAILAQLLGADFAHTVLALDGDHSARVLVAAEANVSYVSLPRHGSLVSRLNAHRHFLGAVAPDIVITYSWGAIEWTLAALLGRVPHIHMEDGFGPEEATRQLLRRVWMRRLALRRSVLVVPSQTLREIATRQWKMPAPGVRYIPNGITPLEGPRAAPAVPGLLPPANLPRIVWAGALRDVKNPLRVVRAFAGLQGKARLVMIGEGPQRGLIEQEAARLSLLPHILLLGNRADAREIIMQCDIMALSSDTEQMPFVVLEAMDAGLPIASVDVGDIRQMVALENRPFIVPPGDQALGRAMERLVGDPALRTRVGKANRLRLRAHYGSGAMVAQYAALFLAMARRDAA